MPTAKPLYVAYYRVSTQRQGDSGLGLDAQRETVTRHVRTVGGRLVAEYTDVMSGRRRSRPHLADAMARAKEAGAVLIVAKLDRLARDAAFLLDLADGRVPLHLCDMPSLGTLGSTVGRLVFTILAGFAEWESKRIGERVREAYQAAVRAGRIKGPPCLRPKAVAAYRRYAKARRAEAVAFAAGVRAVIGTLLESRTLAQVAEWLNRKGIKTREGARWTMGNLWRVLQVR